MRATGVSIAWLAEKHQYAAAVLDRVWADISQRPEWAAWLDENFDYREGVNIVYFEDRSKERLVLRNGDCDYYVPIGAVEAAYQARTLPEFMAEIYGHVWSARADKYGKPSPPPLGDLQELAETVRRRMP